MPKGEFSRDVYTRARVDYTKPGESATARGEQAVRETGKLNPLVDPAEYGVVREARVRFEPGPGSLLKMTMGVPIPIEYRLDTTGSMGDNVARAIEALPHICEFAAPGLPERDPFYCASIFGDVGDNFVLCRGQFECLADRMVNQLTLMLPQGKGGDDPEDPHFGFFGAAYLTNAYLHRVGLRSYDFTITDAPMRHLLSPDQLKRIFGEQVFEKAAENGHQIDPRDLPTNQELVANLQRRAHAFLLLVEHGHRCAGHWREYFGAEHVVLLPRIELLPHVMATIIGLTEGTFDLRTAVDFLTETNMDKREVVLVADRLANIQLGAHGALPNFNPTPQA